MDLTTRYPTFYPRCTRCKQLFTPKSVLENGMCHECNHAPPAYVSWMVWGVSIALVVGLCMVAGCKDTEDMMDQYRAGNFRLAGSYYEYEQFLESESNHE